MALGLAAAAASLATYSKSLAHAEEAEQPKQAEPESEKTVEPAADESAEEE